MKIEDVAKHIDKSKHNQEDIYLSEFGEQFGLNLYNIEQQEERLKCFWVARWYCTDTYVGIRLYFLDDEPVAISTQTGRKSDENIKWFPGGGALNVKKYLMSLLLAEEDLNVDIAYLTEDIGDSIKLLCHEQIIDHDRARLNGQPVTILDRINDSKYPGFQKQLKIQTKNGEEQVVNIDDLDFMFNLSKENM